MKNSGMSDAVVPFRRNGRIVAASVHVTIFGKPLVVYASQQLGVRVGNYCGTERRLDVPNWAELSLAELRDAVERQLKPGDL